MTERHIHVVRRSEGQQSSRTVSSSFEQERREVLETVMNALSSAVPSADEMAACSYLLQHLAGIPGIRAA